MDEDSVDLNVNKDDPVEEEEVSEVVEVKISSSQITRWYSSLRFTVKKGLQKTRSQLLLGR